MILYGMSEFQSEIMEHFVQLNCEKESAKTTGTNAAQVTTSNDSCNTATTGRMNIRMTNNNQTRDSTVYLRE